jgi:energy-coupling factor transporter ATP-binding protein EcfA2
MLLSIYVQNFRSILELKVDFRYGEGKAPNGHAGAEVMPFIEGANGERVVPCLAFFGANASGKTNVLKAAGVLIQLINGKLPLVHAFAPNLIHPKFASTILEFEFLSGADRFVFRVTFDGSAILEEKLSRNGETVYHIANLTSSFASTILSASYTADRLRDILRVECSEGEGRQTKLFLNRIGQSYPGLHPWLRAAFGFLAQSLRCTLNDNTLPLPLGVAILASALNRDDKAAVRKILEVVQRLDIDIQGIEILRREMALRDRAAYPNVVYRDPETGVTEELQIQTTHADVRGRPVQFEFREHESAGTQRLAGLVALILHALETGGVLLVDELECSLHPLLMRELVLLFKKRRHNPKGAQLIFTTHNTDILDDSILRISEIALVRKTAANGTLVRRLVDARKEGEDIRNVTNFRKQYLAGYYAGIPHPAL